MHPPRRHLLRIPVGLLLGPLLTAGPARAARREVDDLGISLELPDDWIPIPRAEILEAHSRAVAAGASTEWTLRAAWQPPPHLRWFTLPHLRLESRAAGGQPDAPPAIEQIVGRAGSRAVYTERADWRSHAVDLRLNLLSLDDRREEFARWVASLRGEPHIPA